MIADVVVVGAGPAGATVGGLIASAGFDVLIMRRIGHIEETRFVERL